MSAEKTNRRKPSLKPLPKNHIVLLHCEWGPCEETFARLDLFKDHISAHVTDLDPEGQFAKQGKLTYAATAHSHEFSCIWRECGSNSFASFVELLRHVYFHLMHSRVKGRGRLLIDHNALFPCSLDSSTHNLIPDRLDAFKCHWASCAYEFDNPLMFYRHIENHCSVNPPGRKVEGGCACLWEGCEAVLVNLSKLNEHMRRHSQEKTVACPNCGGMFANNTKFLDHLNRQRYSDPATSKCYQCSHCNKQFSSERLLRDHLRHHVNSYKCPLCEMTCPSPSGLRHHIQYRHANERPYKCRICSYSGKRHRDLRLHIATHSLDRLHCGETDCDFECKLEQSLLAHYRKEHGTEKELRYMCHECASVFTRGFSLSTHLKTKHNFKWPAGHQRFNYKQHEDGFFRLQTIRYESIELSEQLAAEKGINVDLPPPPTDSYNLKMLGDVAAALREPTDEEESKAFSDMESGTDCSEAVPSVYSEDAVTPSAHSTQPEKRHFRELSISQSSDVSDDLEHWELSSEHSVLQ